MDLKEALSRNRAVFKRLTGELYANREVLAERIKNKEDEPFLRENRAGSSGQFALEAPGSSERKETRRVFSLKTAYGEQRDVFEAPKAPAYPAIRESERVVDEDPLDKLFYRLEVDARRGSQPMSEEG